MKWSLTRKLHMKSGKLSYRFRSKDLKYIVRIGKLEYFMAVKLHFLNLPVLGRRTFLASSYGLMFV